MIRYWSQKIEPCFHDANAPYALQDAEHAPIGAWVSCGYRTAHGEPIKQVQTVTLNALYLPELIEGHLAPEKRGHLTQYTEMIRAGSTPPRIEVIEMEDGRLRVVDGHRRVLSAIAAGLTQLEAYVAPLVNTLNGKVEATKENIATAQNAAKGLSAELLERGITSTPMLLMPIAEKAITLWKSAAHAIDEQSEEAHRVVQKTSEQLALTIKDSGISGIALPAPDGMISIAQSQHGDWNVAMIPRDEDEPIIVKSATRDEAITAIVECSMMEMINVYRSTHEAFISHTHRP